VSNNDCPLPRAKTTKFREKNEFIFGFYVEKHITVVDLNNECE
jgi:hypothetical protein